MKTFRHSDQLHTIGSQSKGFSPAQQCVTKGVHSGGLGDVMGALPKALSRQGHRVMVVAPRYGEYAEGWETGVRRQMRVFGGDQQVSAHCF